jgi:hypothetical protein
VTAEPINFPEGVEAHHAHGGKLGDWCVLIRDLGGIIALELDRLAGEVNDGLGQSWTNSEWSAMYAVRDRLKQRATELREG